MKKLSTILLLFLVFTLPVLGQKKYKGLPVIKANSTVADYKIDKEFIKGNWNIMPQYSPDVLQVPVHGNKAKVVFYTDQDSITYTVKAGKSYQFYVQLNDKAYALTELKGIGYEALKFNSRENVVAYQLLYEQNEQNEYLQTLREQYKLDEVVLGAANDTEKALRMVNWVHKQWKHNGANEPSSPDALTILSEAKDGKQFRCVEYGIVTTAALNAIGLPARTMGLKMKDVETVESGAGHVLLEVFLPDMHKWVMLDAQFDVMPVLKNVPLNAVEFQNAIANNYEDLEIRSLSGTSKASYVTWVAPYLYYFDVRFDNREVLGAERATFNSKQSLMLMPVGAKVPKVFQGKFPMDYLEYTTCLVDFYQAPQLSHSAAVSVKK